MDCNKFEKQIEAFVDDELDRSSRKRIEAHLAECSSCEKTLENLQAVRGILRNSLPAVSTSSAVDDHVMAAFHRKHEQRNTSKPTRWWQAIFGQISLPNPALSFAAIVLLATVGLAFQLGRMSVSEIQSTVPATETADLSAKSPENISSERIVEVPVIKTVEVPVTKIVEVPVVKEKVVTKVVYVNWRQEKDAKNENAPGNFSRDTLALSSSVDEKGFVTQVNLKGFQPASELKTRIIKGEKSNEK